MTAAGGERTPPQRPRDDALERLWKRYRRRPGADLRNRLVEGHQRLVRDVVRRFSARLPRTVDRDDLLIAGNVGLMAAVEAYDPARGVRFEVYAERRIRGALLDELRTQDWLPRPWRARIEQQKRALEALRAELGRNPSDDEVALRMGLDPAEYGLLFGATLPGAPGGSMPPGGRSEEHAPALDVVPDTRSDAPGDKLSREEILRLVAQRLTEVEYRIVYLKYWEELPMREIGEITGLSESRVCKIHTRLLERLKDRLSASAS